MTPRAFTATRKRHLKGLHIKSVVKALGAKSYGEVLAWDIGVKPVPARVTRVLYAPPNPGTNPRRGRAPRNSRFGVSTPEVFYETVHAAAEDNSITYHLAYTRARTGWEGWALVPHQESDVAAD